MVGVFKVISNETSNLEVKTTTMQEECNLTCHKIQHYQKRITCVSAASCCIASVSRFTRSFFSPLVFSPLFANSSFNCFTFRSFKFSILKTTFQELFQHRVRKIGWDLPSYGLRSMFRPPLDTLPNFSPSRQFLGFSGWGPYAPPPQ